MKVVAFNGSPNKEGNTSILINLGDGLTFRQKLDRRRLDELFEKRKQASHAGFGGALANAEQEVLGFFTESEEGKAAALEITERYVSAGGAAEASRR